MHHTIQITVTIQPILRSGLINFGQYKNGKKKEVKYKITVMNIKKQLLHKRIKENNDRSMTCLHEKMTNHVIH
jgi:hypothetical protein